MMQKIIKKPDIKISKVSLIEPSGHHYILLAAEIDKSFLPFFLGTSAKKKELLRFCKEYCRLLEQVKGVHEANVFKALLIPPGRGKFLKKRKEQVHIAKFDLVVLIEAENAGTVTRIKEKVAYQQIKKAIEGFSDYSYFKTATNVKRIGPVNHKKQGIFLFNFFFADNVEQNIGIWEYTAGWFQQETGLDNSTVLLPSENSNSDYAIINHCRWDNLSDILPSLILKKSFRNYVLQHFYLNNVAAMPILYKLA